MWRTNWLAAGSLAAFIGAAALLTVPSAYAYSNLLILWQLQYSASSSDDNALPAGCQLCHIKADGKGGKNPYGSDWVDAWPSNNPTTPELEAAFVAIEGLDSDNDPTGSSNLAEITANTQPGWAEGDNPPSIIGDLDPSIGEPPVADANGPYNGVAGEPVLFDASGSTDPNGDGTIVSYTWDFGDGTSPVMVATATVNHSYTTAGSYNVSLVVEDDTGLTDSDSTTATIDSPADIDGDGVLDSQDNCTLVPNGPLILDAGGNSQLDTDGDNYGNICDADLDNTGFVDFPDLTLFSNVFFTADPDADFNGDAFVDFDDLTLFSDMFFQAPGPSCVDLTGGCI